MDYANIHDLIDEAKKTLPDNVHFHDFTEEHSSAPIQAEELDGNWLTIHCVELRNTSGKSSRIEISKDLLIRKDFLEAIDKAIQELK